LRAWWQGRPETPIRPRIRGARTVPRTGVLSNEEVSGTDDFQ
jgi:hypothetical protein